MHVFPSQIFPTGRCCCNTRPSDPPPSRRFQPCLVSSVLCFGASKFDPYLSGWRHGITTYLQDAVKFCWTFEAKCHLRRGNPDVNAGYRMKSLSKNLLVVPFKIWMKLIFRFLDRDLFFYGGHPPKRESEWIIRTMFVHLSSWRKISRGGSHSRRQWVERAGSTGYWVNCAPRVGMVGSLMDDIAPKLDGNTAWYDTQNEWFHVSSVCLQVCTSVHLRVSIGSSRIAALEPSCCNCLEAPPISASWVSARVPFKLLVWQSQHGEGVNGVYGCISQPWCFSITIWMRRIYLNSSVVKWLLPCALRHGI